MAVIRWQKKGAKKKTKRLPFDVICHCIQCGSTALEKTGSRVECKTCKLKFKVEKA